MISCTCSRTTILAQLYIQEDGSSRWAPECAKQRGRHLLWGRLGMNTHGLLLLSLLSTAQTITNHRPYITHQTPLLLLQEFELERLLFRSYKRYNTHTCSLRPLDYSNSIVLVKLSVCQLSRPRYVLLQQLRWFIPTHPSSFSTYSNGNVLEG